MPKVSNITEQTQRKGIKGSLKARQAKKHQREKVILQMTADGLKPKEIANRLQVSVGTVYLALRSKKAEQKLKRCSPLNTSSHSDRSRRQSPTRDLKKKKGEPPKSFERFVTKMDCILETPETLQQWLSEIIPRRHPGLAELTTLPQSQFTDAQYPRLLLLLEALKQRQAVEYIENELSVTVVIHKRT